MDNIKRAAAAGVALSVAVPYVAGIADGKAPSSDPMKVAKFTISVVTSASTDTGATDGSLYVTNNITGKDVRAFAPAIRKPTTEQST